MQISSLHPLSCLPAINSSPFSEIGLQSPFSSCQQPCTPVDPHPNSGYVGPWHQLFMWFSFPSDGHRSASLPSNILNSSPLSQPISLDARISPLLQPSYPEVQVWSFLLSSFSLLSFILPSYLWICIILSGGQGLLLVFSWHSIASVDVFLTYPWSKRHSTSTYLPSWLLLRN